MRMWNRLLVVGLALAGLCAVARADTVVLTNGARVSGELSRVRNGVAIRSPSGTLTVPFWRIAQVLRGSEAPAPQPISQEMPTPAPASAPAQIAPPAPAPRPGAQPSPQLPAPPMVSAVLASKMSVSFDGASVYDAMVYIREVTGVNMALANEVRAAQALVHLNVRDVPLYTILQLILEPAGLAYAIRPGEVLYVGRLGTVQPVMRIYPVTDLLLSIEDKTGGIGGANLGTGTQGGSSTSRRGGSESTSVNPQYSQPRSGARLSTGGAQGRGGTASAGFSPLSARAENLILLIKSSCGAGTWADPYSSGLIDAGGGRLPVATQGISLQTGF